MRAETTKIPHLLFEKGLLKTPNVLKCVILFTIDDLYDGNGRKNTEIFKNENKGKNTPLGCLSITLSTKMEADCFLVSENTGN